jgi:hypothetical protein
VIGKTENQFSLTQVSPSRRGAQNQISVSNTSLLLLLALVVLAAIPRIVATHNDLWLDEIVSVQKVRTLASPWEIFTSIHRDNNHHLNSLYLYLVRNTSYDPTFRYFSVLCGVLTVLAGYWTVFPRGKRTALLFATLLACSYPLIHFSSEARGYSAMILGSVVALGSALRWMEKPSIAMELLYGVAISFALLSHLTVCLVWGSLAVGMLLSALIQNNRRTGLLRLTAMNLLPLTVLLFLYFEDLRHMQALSGPSMSLVHGLSRMTALSVGWPLKDDISAIAISVLLLVLIIREVWRRRSNGDSLVLLLVMLTPIGCALTLRSSFFVPRYFLFTVPFLYFGLALLLDNLSAVRFGKFIVPVLIAFFLIGQSFLYANFLKVGRGQITTALRVLKAAETPNPTVSITSNQDFRGSVECRYFQDGVPGKKILYLVSSELGNITPDWFVIHREGYQPPGPPQFVLLGTTWYRAGYFGASELSGQAWTVYSAHRVNLGTQP